MNLGARHLSRRIIGFALIAILTAVSIPTATACSMDQAIQSGKIAASTHEAAPCHDARSNSESDAERDSGPAAGPNCLDCLDHCPMHAQAALLLRVRMQLAGAMGETPQRPSDVVLEAIGSRHFKPPKPVSTLKTRPIA